MNMMLVALLFIFFVSHLNAQPADRNYFYLSGQIGTVAYHGDLTSVNTDEPMFHLGMSGGIGYVLSPRFSLRTDYRRGEYKRTERPNAQGYWRRHNIGLYATYDILDNTSIKPYLLAGAGMTFYGTYDKGVQERDGSTFFGETFGPAVGIGLEYPLSNRFSLKLEGIWDFILDDEAMDEIDDNGMDILTYIGAGLKFNLRPTFIPIPGVRLTGPTRLVEGEEGEYTASLIGPATRPITYEWDFGDGTTGTGSTVRHRYAEQGTYVITVTASNVRSSDERSLQVTVDRRTIPARIVSLSADDTTPEPHQTVRFTGQVEGTEPISIEWDFGDGTTSHELHTQHAYAQTGEYTVTLTADNTEVAGEEGIHSRTINISVREPEIILELDTMVNFNFDSAVLRPEAIPVLNEVVEILQTDTDIILAEVAGHTCDIGTTEYNQGLSERRARAVANYLIEQGIDEDRLVVIGYGEERPRVPNISIENRQQNRRVVITVKERD